MAKIRKMNGNPHKLRIRNKDGVVNVKRVQRVRGKIRVTVEKA